jgi:hypothetical protein
MKAVFKDATPAESSRFFRQTAEAFRQDPVSTLAHLGTQAGLHPLQLAQAIAQRFGQQPMQQYQSQQGYDAAQFAAVDAMIRDFSEKNPRLNDLEPEVTALLRSDQFQNSAASPQRKLEVAFLRM